MTKIEERPEMILAGSKKVSEELVGAALGHGKEIDGLISAKIGDDLTLEYWQTLAENQAIQLHDHRELLKKVMELLPFQSQLRQYKILISHKLPIPKELKVLEEVITMALTPTDDVAETGN